MTDAPPPALRLDDGAPADAELARHQALYKAWRAGDRAALAQLLTELHPRLFAICAGMSGDRDHAEDLAQDALVKIIQGLPTFGFRSRLSTWATRIAINVCLSDRRKLRFRRTPSLHSGPDTPGPNAPESREPGPLERVQSQEDRERLTEALHGLEPEQRAILLLRDGQGVDYAELSSILDIPEGTVKSRLFRARATLRARLEEA